MQSYKSALQQLSSVGEEKVKQYFSSNAVLFYTCMSNFVQFLIQNKYITVDSATAGTKNTPKQRFKSMYKQILLEVDGRLDLSKNSDTAIEGALNNDTARAIFSQVLSIYIKHIAELYAQK